MALSIFIDALPYNEVVENYMISDGNIQVSQLLPNIAYSSSLHWQLYCDKYPDQRGMLVDWVRETEKSVSVRVLSTVLAPLDGCGDLAVLARKVLDRIVYRRNTFANIPFRFRKDFTQKGKYLFWSEETYRAEPIFDGYRVISQDEGRKSFDETVNLLRRAIEDDEKNIFAVFGEVDGIGHKCRRGPLYSQRLKPVMDKILEAIWTYAAKNPEEEILIVSDHGMSTVENRVDLELERRFGKPSRKRYIAYCDTAILCVFCADEQLKTEIEAYLKTRTEGHLLTQSERKQFGATDVKFGDLIYILREGNVFTDNWFGKSLKKPNPDGAGMHGFWPERCAEDQMACMILINGKEKLPETTDYPQANRIITQVMKGNERT